ncbi:MAG TPA: TolC family protein [Ferruginibacter sp.]|nr:TolC family protein [Ferruginibacter sp.]HRN91686.1 TolC family protein [Ferruginibacter sp.]HRO06078.1 TolC family protein [Ferruginibacter sp.]HRO95667.1 TolC family protein [Ferruginibacter sp.]HRP49324.1 TolC family protein [Ferruginibacter sp.]
MKSFAFFLFMLCLGFQSELQAQALGRVPDSVRKQYDPPPQSAQRTQMYNSNGVQITEVDVDSLIKIKLVKLATKNHPAIGMAEANTRIAEADYQRAKKAWMSSVSFGANINEFVVSNPDAANFFPKYNLGAMVPLDLFARMKREKKVATEQINISNLQKTDRLRYIKAEVLMRYENYKEKKEIVNLQRSYLEYDLLAYEAAKRDYAEGDIPMEQMNKAHQIYITEKSKLTTRERDLNIAIIQLEEMIGTSLETALQLP